MKGHRFDPVSFCFGLFFAAASAFLWVDTFRFSGFRWLGAGLLLLLGILLIATSRSGSQDKS